MSRSIQRAILGATSTVGLAVILAACSTGRSSDGGTADTIAASPPSLHSMQEQLPTTVRPGSTSLAWHLQRVDTIHDRVFLWADTQKECSTPYAATATSTQTSIVITVHGTKRENGPCTLEKTTMVGYVQLASPLGDRSIHHAPTGS